MSGHSRRRVLAGLAGVGTAGVVGTRGAAAETAGGDVLWSTPVTNYTRSSPTVIDGTVFVDGHVLDAADGTRHAVLAEGSVEGAPAVASGLVFLGAGTVVDAYEADADPYTERRWRFRDLGETESAPTVLGETVYAGSLDGAVYAVDAFDGTLRWATETGGPVRSSPTVVDGTVYVGSDDQRLHALDAATGDREWTVETGHQVWSSPTVADGTVFVGSRDQRVYAVAADTGARRWATDLGLDVTSSPTVADGTVYVGGGEETLYALSIGDGSVRWTHDTGAGVYYSSPTVADDAVFVGDREGRVLAVGAADGSERWRVQVERGVRCSPTVVDGVVYVGGRRDTVYALDAGVAGSSRGSRVRLGTLGHHGDWAERASSERPATATASTEPTRTPTSARDAQSTAPTGTATDGTASPTGGNASSTGDGSSLPTGWLAGWLPLLSWLAGITLVGPLVVGGLLAAVEWRDRADEEDDRPGEDQPGRSGDEA